MKFLRFVYILSCVIIPANLYAQGGRYDKVITHIDSINNSKNALSIDDFVSIAICDHWNEKERTFGIYYWVSKNITYDKSYNIINDDRSIEEIAISTFKSRKAICWGFTCLYEYLCKKAGIKCETINGYSRSHYFKLGKSVFADVDSRHSWNSVFIENKWILIDVTFAKSNSKTRDFYFDVDPEIFILTHFPENPKWQLTNQKRDSSFFNQLPYLSSMFFIDGFSYVYPETGIVYLKDRSEVDLLLNHPSSFRIRIQVFHFESDKWYTPEYDIDETLGGSKVNIKLGRKGKYIIRVDSVTSDDHNIYYHNGVIAYLIKP